MRALENDMAVQEYIRVREQMAALEERERELRSELTDALLMEDGEKFEHMGCTFTITRRRTWEYDPEVQEQIDKMRSHVKDVGQQIKDIEKHAQQTKRAQVVEMPAVMVFKAPKR